MTEGKPINPIKILDWSDDIFQNNYFGFLNIFNSTKNFHAITKIDDKEFLVDENTIVFNRSKSNDFANWQGLMYELEESGVNVINSIDVHLICADKWKTYIKLKNYYEFVKIHY